MNARTTIFSPCRKYRYTLWREWDEVPLWAAATGKSNQYVQFIGLNPSTADETLDDPTIRRCIGFSKAWGYGALCMTNLFAWRDTDPQAMRRVADPTGMQNNTELLNCAKGAALIIAAWGKHGRHRDRDDWVKKMMFDCGFKLNHLGLNDDGTPKHPLHLKGSTLPAPF